MNSRIVNSKSIFEHKKLKSNYYLSKGLIYKELIEKNNFNRLKDKVSKISNIGVNKRYYVEKKEFGVPFFSNTDLGSPNPIDNCKLVSKKLCYNGERIIKEGMTLVSAVGTIGLVAFATKEIAGAMTPIGNLIRLEAKEYPGFLYAFLSTKIGQKLIDQLGSGNVQTYLDPTTFGEIPIPNLDKIKQQEIHNLIIEASNLRVEANKLLKEAVEYFNSLKIDYKYGTATSRKISISGISNGYKRFDSAYAIVSKLVEDSLQSNQIDYVTIRSQSSGIFIGPRAKRNYVTSGTPFLSTSAMQKANPTKVDKYISPKSSDGFIVKEGWILTTRSGTLGDTIYTLPCISGFAVSEDAIRVVLKEDAQISNEYLFAFLKSSIGRSSLLSGSYGSVILHLNENYIGDIKVPILAKEIIEEIEAKVGQHLKNMNEAILKENQAIDLVEKEIESWQK